MKLTFDGILKECNRIAAEAELNEHKMWFKSQLARLDIDYNKGLIDTDAYNKRQSQILKELDMLSRQKPVSMEGGASVEF
jgi:hypothetical protein